MKRQSKKKFSSKYVLLIMTIICIIIIALSAEMNISTGPVGKAVGQVIVPMQKGLNQIGNALNLKKLDIQTKEELQAENDELKTQIATLEEQLSRVSIEQEELQQLREIYAMDQTYESYEKVAANIVGKDTSNWFATFIIDKGSKDGIEIGHNVVADGGLVGIVVDVGSNYAKVRSIIDDSSNVSALDLNSSDNCIVNGSLKSMNERQQLTISDLRDSDDNVQVGDQLVTSSISDKYLPNIPIGYIVEITSDSNKLTKTGYLATIVDFEHLQKVLVIKELKDYPDVE